MRCMDGSGADCCGSFIFVRRGFHPLIMVLKLGVQRMGVDAPAFVATARHTATARQSRVPGPPDRADVWRRQFRAYCSLTFEMRGSVTDVLCVFGTWARS